MTEDEQKAAKSFIDECEKQGIIDARQFPCPECESGEMKQVGFTSPNGTIHYECNECGHTESYP